MKTLHAWIQTCYQANVVRFGVVGLGNTAIDFVIFFTLYHYLGMWFVWANIISFSAAVTHSYLLNKYWSFRHQNPSTPATPREFTLFVLISIGTLSLNTAILVVGEPHAPMLLLKILGALIVPITNYFAYRYFVFVK